MSPSIKFFTGAPAAIDLDWSNACLLEAMIPCFDTSDMRQDVPSTSGQANWRHIFLAEKAPKTKPYGRRVSDVEARPDELVADTSEVFIEHSLAILDALQSSQLAPHEKDEVVEDEESTFLTNESFTTSFDASTNPPSLAAISPSLSRHPLKPIRASITPLDCIPSAKHLLRSRPQTITVNLIIGIISISATRTVHVKRGDYDMEIVELTVGDETKAGFSISIWMSPQTGAKKDMDVRRTVELLRPGNVVYVARLALADFNGQVFGQSLNRRASGVVTSFVPLEAGMMSRSVLHDPLVVAKTERVSAWVDDYVGTRNAHARKRKIDDDRQSRPVKTTKTAVLRDHEWLPDDSPG
ncbi:Hypothetical protein D9617_3g019870 [Elsinoe fawcettii]|nr:Hypothetical protein D9617_3g019870 [Elsinoe fawcettii]